MPWQTEDATLERHFSNFGSIEEAQIMREKYTGKSRGFGFVTFASTLDAQRAVAAEHIIDGRRCEAKFALPEGKVGSARTTRIFVARIPSSVTDAQFRGYFEQFGGVQDAYMPKDPSKQAHRGIGFVTYASAEAVERVMASSHILNGNEVAIDRATPKERGALLPGRLSMSQPNLHMLSGASTRHSSSFSSLMRAQPGLPPPQSPPSKYEGGAPFGGLGTRRMSHPVLGTGAGQYGSPPTIVRMGSGQLGFGPQTGSMQYNSQSSSRGQPHVSTLGSKQMTGSFEGLYSSSQKLLNLVHSNVAATAAAASGPGPSMALPHGFRPNSNAAGPQGNLSKSASDGRFPASTASSSSDLVDLMPHQEASQLSKAQTAWHQSALPWANPAAFPLAGPMGATGGPPSARAGPRIFVGKLHRDTNEYDVKEYFSRFGFVLDVYLPRDKANKREHRGFGFVTFETEAAIQRVVSHGAHHIRGGLVAIDAAVPRQEESITLAGGLDPTMLRPLNNDGAVLPTVDPNTGLQGFESMTLTDGPRTIGGVENLEMARRF